MDSEDYLPSETSSETSSEISLSCANNNITHMMNDTYAVDDTDAVDNMDAVDNTNAVDNMDDTNAMDVCNELTKEGTMCNHIIETDGSTGNFSYHFQSIHEVTKFSKLILDTSYLSFDEMFINSLKIMLNITYDTQVNVNLDNANTAFDDDQEFQEEINLIDEPEILDVESEAKLNRIKINIPQVCDGMVENAEAYLITEYEAFKEQEPIPTNTVQMDDDPDKEENVLLAAMYESIQESDTNTEIQVYLALPRIPNTQ
ncbi:5877_t:CDS:2, partial [Cetraspora pellucida]